MGESGRDSDVGLPVLAGGVASKNIHFLKIQRFQRIPGIENKNLPGVYREAE